MSFLTDAQIRDIERIPEGVTEKIPVSTVEAILFTLQDVQSALPINSQDYQTMESMINGLIEMIDDGSEEEDEETGEMVELTEANGSFWFNADFYASLNDILNPSRELPPLPSIDPNTGIPLMELGGGITGVFLLPGPQRQQGVSLLTGKKVIIEDLPGNSN